MLFKTQKVTYSFALITTKHSHTCKSSRSLHVFMNICLPSRTKHVDTTRDHCPWPAHHLPNLLTGTQIHTYIHISYTCVCVYIHRHRHMRKYEYILYFHDWDEKRVFFVLAWSHSKRTQIAFRNRRKGKKVPEKRSYSLFSTWTRKEVQSAVLKSTFIIPRGNKTPYIVLVPTKLQLKVMVFCLKVDTLVSSQNLAIHLST